MACRLNEHPWEVCLTLGAANSVTLNYPFEIIFRESFVTTYILFMVSER